eukprot:TRINITY_DN67722_c1_g15_i1.p1 TRINITY_DN67722_c1_g15~~TRINITY_DN67722_c1_g15_i1.p1  ORF type:complete len:371 (-),score=201.90 TRINITY_DN67722_c1_g15_i1:149-1213(-)
MMMLRIARRSSSAVGRTGSMATASAVSGLMRRWMSSSSGKKSDKEEVDLEAMLKQQSTSTATDGVRLPSSLVTTDWVAANYASVRLVDASWFIPSVNEDAYRNFMVKRLPGSVFFDIDEIADPDSTLPHMMPSEQQFADVVGETMGLTVDDNIVVYDSIGIFSAPRVWYTFRMFGAKNVAILDGGLPQWVRDDLPTASGPSVCTYPKAKFEAKMDRKRIKDMDEMLANAFAPPDQRLQVIDARSAGRFDGVEDEPRPGLRGGHMPHSINVPFTYLLDDFTLSLKSPEAIKKVFQRAGVDLRDKHKTIVTTCGSGITAAFLAYGLHLIGHDDVSLYDGSWSEWGAQSDTPVHSRS